MIAIPPSFSPCPGFPIRLPFNPETVDSRSQSVSQQQPRSMKPSLHGGSRDSKNHRGLFGAQMLHVSKNERLPVTRAERIDCVLNRLPYLILLKQFGRYRPPVGIVSRPKISV